ncbi:MAG: tRNA (N(6)-L-threonylcarbamoyladenosine(37)-C(2))-methylthiotransferase MtaB [Clostridia bacterium]|nr:tRNA (N(6)-L-threonylcarbamoyladenosine(37)-C(2))-methylthiotransferase MtaB [Clostridia bacterium]
MKKVAFITLGCKVNQYETNAMTQQFLQKEYEIIEPTEKADIYIINTCTVTNMSDRKSRQMLRRAKEKNKQAIVVACGCYVQVAKEEVEKIEEIDLIIGNNEKKEIVDIIEKYIKEHKKNEKIEDVMTQKQYVELGEITYTDKTRAVIKVQDGCDRFCSYCIIPYARGRVRSRNPKIVIEEIEKIAKQGIQEVVITGIHIASYGKDFKENYRLIDLLEQINKIDGIKRIRLGSIEPLLITEEFLTRLSKLEKICHQFHLSLQSGCNETLERMNRRYTIEQFKEIVQNLRKTYEDVILTTDIIVGFPQESDQEFEKTYQFLKEIKFYKMHIFKYSPRHGTKAAQMKRQINSETKDKRSQKLIKLSNKNQKEYHEKYIGKEVEVLFEEEKNGYYQGHTKNYILSIIKSDENLENKMLKAKCIKAENDHILLEMSKCNKNVTNA